VKTRWIRLLPSKTFSIIQSIVNVLLPGDPRAGLPSGSTVIEKYWDSSLDWQTQCNSFISEYQEYLGHECSLGDVNELQLVDFLDKSRLLNADFLNTLLELYYTDKGVLEFYPDFSGVTFPNSRKMPSNSFELLEPVVMAEKEKEV
jgi:hypothetical protein